MPERHKGKDGQVEFYVAKMENTCAHVSFSEKQTPEVTGLSNAARGVWHASSKQLT